MDREEKVKGEERQKRELMGGKLERGILVGKRGGNSTPSPTWNFGIIQPDGTLIQDFNFSTVSNIISARKLVANLWEMQPQLNHRVPKMSKNRPNLSHHKEDNKFGVANELGEAPVQSPSKQPTSGINSRKQLAAPPSQYNLKAKKVEQAQQPLSTASYCSSMEMAPHGPAISPNGFIVSNGKFGELSHSVKTSTELLKVLNRIWSLEEKHVLDMSLVKTLKRELDQSQARTQELLQDKKRDQNEISNLLKQITELKVVRKKELENELKLRRHSEKRHHKLAKELSETKSSFSNALKELERERKARTLLEDLCDEFAKGIRDYEQEVRFLKQKSSEDRIGTKGIDRLILHFSEAWLDERTQIKLADAHDTLEKQSSLDKLCFEIETFLQERQYGKNSWNNDYMPPINPYESAHSLETFHLNEPASAPWKANEEDNSVSIGNNCSQFCRGLSLKQANAFARRQEEITSDGRVKETAKPNKKVQSRKSLEEEGELTKSRTEDLHETNKSRMLKKGDMMQRSSLEGKNKINNANVDLQDTTTRNTCISCMEGSFDPSMFTGPTSPIKKWTSEVSVADPEISESSSRWPKSVKPNTLKAKLIEARLEGQQSRARTSKGLSQVN